MFSFFRCCQIDNNKVEDPVKISTVEEFYNVESKNKISIIKYHYIIQKRIMNFRYRNSEINNRINYLLIIEEPYNFIIDYNDSDIMTFKELNNDDKNYYLNNNNYKETIDVNKDWLEECYKLYLNTKTNNDLNKKLKIESGIVIEKYKPIIKITI
jgi:hypothetical protein